MAKVREIREMADYIRGLSSVVRKATARALVKAAQAASNQAKKNAKVAFTGTAERPKSGFLMNAIFAGFELGGDPKDPVIADAFVAVRSRKGNLGTRPYGRIHEFGGDIVPVKAKNLWIPLIGPKTSGAAGEFRDLSPRDFMERFLKQGKRGHTKLHFKAKAGRGGGGKIRVRKSVDASYVFVPGKAGPIAGVSHRVGRGKTARALFVALFQLRKRVTMPARPYVTPAVEAEKARLFERLSREIEIGHEQPGGGELPKGTI